MNLQMNGMADALRHFFVIRFEKAKITWSLGEILKIVSSICCMKCMK